MMNLFSTTKDTKGTKGRKGFLLFSLLICVLAGMVGVGVWASGYVAHGLPSGELLDAQALENGGAVVLVLEGDTLHLGLYDRDGAMVAEQVFPREPGVEKVGVQTCGGVTQLFVSAENAGGPNTNTRYVWDLGLETGCFPHVWLPIVEVP